MRNKEMKDILQGTYIVKFINPPTKIVWSFDVHVTVHRRHCVR
jgi:hypothetical protein